ncbi:MAG: YihY/virulence factor BrkB family protein [Candidatus Saelkia tenebricola]|nr:YihY/virulence factor BrkB family protein [Candidatus Saelkia tenebricola]
MANKLGRVFRKPGFFIKCIVNNFTKDKCNLHAAALTFITLLTLIPFLALLFAISKGLGIQNFLQNIVLEKLALGKQDLFLNIIKYIKNTNLTTLGTTGIIFLFLTVIRLLGSIETVFNSIWEVNAPRRITRKISDYLTVVILCPIFVFLTFTFTATISSNILVQNLLKFSFINNVYFSIIKFLPFISIWLALSIFYMFMPNKKVNLTTGLISGIIAGTIWQIFQWGYLKFQIGITRYNAIYGTFATLPIFMVWIYFSWIVILLGAELGFVFQNRRNLKNIQRDNESSLLELNDILKTLKFMVKKFQDGEFPLNHKKISGNLNIHDTKIIKIINYLKEHNILIVKEDEIYFLKNPDNIALSEIIFINTPEENNNQHLSQIIEKITNNDALNSYKLTDLI